jgi:putative DNA primase/helicase
MGRSAQLTKLGKDAAEWYELSNGKPNGRTALEKLYEGKEGITNAMILRAWQGAAKDSMAKAEEIAKKRSEAGKKGGRPKLPVHADIADQYAAARMTDEGGLITSRYWRGQWWTYHHLGGWEEASGDEILGDLTNYMKHEPELRKYATQSYVSSVMLNMRTPDLCLLPTSAEWPVWLDTMEAANNWVSFANGQTVNVYDYANASVMGTDTTKHVTQSSARLFSTDYVDYAFDPKAKCPKFLKYLDEIQPSGDNIKAIQVMLGLLITDLTRAEVCWQLYGNGANGKTVLLDIISALVGKRNISGVNLSGLIGRFQAWPLATSKVNICGELPTDIGTGNMYHIEGAFKDAVSGGQIECEKKGKDKFMAKCRARFIMATNSLPSFFDRSDGIWRRLRIIPFPVQIPEEERNDNLAAEIIETDMPGIMNWAIEGLMEYIALGRVEECREGAAEKSKHRLGCDHERLFLEEHYINTPDHGDRVEAKGMYQKYAEWIRDNGYKPLGSSKFYARIEQIWPNVDHKRARIGEGVKVCMCGVRTKLDMDGLL